MTDEYKIIFPPDILGGYHSRQQEDSRLLSQSKSRPLFLFLSSPPSSFHSVVSPASRGFTFNLLISVSQLPASVPLVCGIIYTHLCLSGSSLCRDYSRESVKCGCKWRKQRLQMPLHASICSKTPKTDDLWPMDLSNLTTYAHPYACIMWPVKVQISESVSTYSRPPTRLLWQQ